jgi:hypothetical protein
VEYAGGSIDDQGNCESGNDGYRHDFSEMFDDPGESVNVEVVENVGKD